MGFRYHQINLDLFRDKMHMDIEGTFGFYLEIPGSKLSQRVENDPIDLFVDKSCSNRNFVHKTEWRYPVVDHGVYDINDPYYSILITFDLIENVYPDGIYTIITNKEHNWFGTQNLGFRYTFIDLGIFNRSYTWLPMYDYKECIGTYIEIDNLYLSEENQEELFTNFSDAVIKEYSYAITHNKRERHLITSKVVGSEDEREMNVEQIEAIYLFFV